MKRFKKCLLLLPLLFIMGGCNNSTPSNNNDIKNKVNIVTGDLTNKDFIELKSQDSLDALREAKNDFIIYAYVQGCSSCGNFEIKLKQYIDDFGVTIYKINYNTVLSNGDPLKIAGAAPVIGFYKEGKRLYVAAYDTSDKKQFTDNTSFMNMMEKYVSLPNALYISPSQFDLKKNAKENMIVLFTRSSCGDCQSLFSDFFNDYLSNNKNKKIYLIECDKNGIRYDENGKFNQEQWQAFKDKYQLSKLGSELYGYETGVVPTFQYYKEGILSDSNVYVNDSYKKELISNATYRVTITNSFIKELINQSFEFDATDISDSDLDGRIYEAVKEFVKETHVKSLTAFLSKY